MGSLNRKGSHKQLQGSEARITSDSSLQFTSVENGTRVEMKPSSSPYIIIHCISIVDTTMVGHIKDGEPIKGDADP